MARSVLFCIEGVLVDDSLDVPVYSGFSDGILLFHALASTFGVVLSTLSLDQYQMSRWLVTTLAMRSPQWSRLLVAEEGESEADTRSRHLNFLRSTGSEISYVVTADPAFARASIAAGVTPLCCPHPAYSRPSFLPTAGEGKAQWDAIEAEVLKGKISRLEDRRLDPDAEEWLDD